MSIMQNRQEIYGTAGLLALVGVGLVVGYSLHLAGFTGWMTLAVAGASLLIAGGLWRNQSGFSIPAIVVAFEGAILCTLALPDQFDNGEIIAALANMAIIATMIATAAKILRQSK
jgi:hypothetical protein